MNLKSYFPAFLNGFFGLLVVGVSFWSKDAISVDKAFAKPFGIILVFLGIAGVSWAGSLHKSEITVAVTPKLNRLIKTGPYKAVRHPIYLGLTVALIGVAASLQSWLGLVCTFILFLPSVVYRAKLEEKSLAQKFGAEWEVYRKETGFLFPVLGHRKNSA